MISMHEDKLSARMSSPKRKRQKTPKKSQTLTVLAFVFIPATFAAVSSPSLFFSFIIIPLDLDTIYFERLLMQ